MRAAHCSSACRQPQRESQSRCKAPSMHWALHLERHKETACKLPDALSTWSARRFELARFGGATLAPQDARGNCDWPSEVLDSLEAFCDGAAPLRKHRPICASVEKAERGWREGFSIANDMSCFTASIELHATSIECSSPQRTAYCMCERMHGYMISMGQTRTSCTSRQACQRRNE
jgi:hypothetical protein